MLVDLRSEGDGMQQTTMEPEYLRTEEFAEKARTSANTVRYWRRIGYGPSGVRVGRRVLYRTTDVNGWLEQLSAEQSAKGGDSCVP